LEVGLKINLFTLQNYVIYAQILNNERNLLHNIICVGKSVSLYILLCRVELRILI